MNIIDYVSKNNLTMKDLPLNEVDSLVLSQLSYLYYEKVALPCKISDLNNYFYDLLGTDRDDLNNLNRLYSHIRSKENQLLFLEILPIQTTKILSNAIIIITYYL